MKIVQNKIRIKVKVLGQGTIRGEKKFLISSIKTDIGYF